MTSPSRPTHVPWPVLGYSHALSKPWLRVCGYAGESHFGLTGKQFAPDKGTDK